MQRAQRAELASAFAGLFKSRPQLTPVEWCESQLTLTGATDYPGPYSTVMTPYVREILMTLTDYNIESVVCCFGAQTAKTNTYMAASAWLMANDPAPMMWVMPNATLAKDTSVNRLQPLIFSSEEIMEARTGKREDIKKDSITLSTMTLTLVGSNSPANLASRPVRYMFLDEVDKFPLGSRKEGAAVDLAKERTRSFSEPKIFESSTPTTVDGTIWQEYLNGDQRRYFVPCPHCGKDMLFVFNPERSAFENPTGCEAKLIWDSSARRRDGDWDYDKVASTAHFVCPHCKGKVYNEDKAKMLRLGHWKPTNAPYADGRVRSYHISTFYAPWPKARWGALAVEFLKAKRGLLGVRNFINSICAEPDVGQYDGGGARRELVLLNPSELNAPAQKWRIMTVDVQADCFYYVARDWFAGGNSILAEWAKVDTFDDIEEAARRLSVEAVGLDSGYRAADVYAECAARGWFALRGDERQSWPHASRKTGRKIERPYVTREFDPMLGTAEQGKRRVFELRWSNPAVKDILARLRDSQTSPVRWAIPSFWATEEYFRHLNGEWKKNVANPQTGRVRSMWVLRSRRWPNHLFDCECMQIACALYNGILKTIDDNISAGKDSA